jgi:nitric oxide reductase NorE protein
LLLSSLLVATATEVARGGESRRLARRLLLGAMVCGVVFVVIKVVEYHEQLASGHRPGTNGFYMYYFTLTGIHLVHLIFGLGALVVLRKLAGAPTLTPTQRKFLEAGACFWHMVDILWIVIFPVLFLVQ